MHLSPPRLMFDRSRLRQSVIKATLFMVICLFLCVCRQSCGYAYGKLRRFARYAGAVAEVIGRVKRCLDIGDRQVLTIRSL